MQTFINPPADQWESLTIRAMADKATQVSGIVSDIITNVADNGDKAIREYEQRFTGAVVDSLAVSPAEFDEAEAMVDTQLKSAIITAASNIRSFHQAQMPVPVEVETAPGVCCWQRAVPIDRVGLYIPGGNSPLFSTVLMLAVPAVIAGCKEIIMCTPANADGHIHPAILYAARAAGVTRVFKTGGAQAIAAMACGTESIPRVDKIFGPGNRYVMEAKQQVSLRGVAIDMPAGPSEVMVIADSSANPEFVAADFLSQAEHGPDSQSLLLTDSMELLHSVPQAIDRFLNELPRREMMESSLSHSRIIVMDSIDRIMEFANMYAPEHLIINRADAETLALQVRNAGSVFLGPFSTESAGDYASGTNHTLPTSGYARAYSGVNLDSFFKKITFQHLSADGVRSIGPAVTAMAEAEDLHAHRLAMALRMNSL